jgi:hypothetical protein
MGLSNLDRWERSIETALNALRNETIALDTRLSKVEKVDDKKESTNETISEISMKLLLDHIDDMGYRICRDTSRTDNPFWEPTLMTNADIVSSLHDKGL